MSRSKVFPREKEEELNKIFFPETKDEFSLPSDGGAEGMNAWASLFRILVGQFHFGLRPSLQTGPVK